MDLECGSFLSKHLMDAVRGGVVDEARLDEAVSNLMRVQVLQLLTPTPHRLPPISCNNRRHHPQMRLGYFDPAEGQPLLKVWWQHSRDRGAKAGTSYGGDSDRHRRGV